MAESPGRQRNFSEIVLTGGPAAGKSSALSYLTEALSEEGIRVLTVPEVPTMVFTSGISDIGRIAADDPDLYSGIERRIVSLQSDLRRNYRALAEGFAPEPVCIIYDRAELDAIAYSSEQLVEEVLGERGDSLISVRDSYDAVICLRSSACGTGYTMSNNPARTETEEQARRMDDRTLRVWFGHHHFWIVDAAPTLEDKLERVGRIVKHALGIPASVEIERKYLLRGAPDLDLLGPMRRVEIKQTYLLCTEPGVERRVRLRRENGAEVYHWAEKKDVEGSLARNEREALISRREYERLLAEADPGRAPLRKTRHHFEWAGRHFELDHFPGAGGKGDGLWLLEVELLDEQEQPELPPGLEIEREVSGEAAYRSASIAADLLSAGKQPVTGGR